MESCHMSRVGERLRFVMCPRGVTDGDLSCVHGG